VQAYSWGAYVNFCLSSTLQMLDLIDTNFLLVYPITITFCHHPVAWKMLCYWCIKNPVHYFTRHCGCQGCHTNIKNPQISNNVHVHLLIIHMDTIYSKQPRRTEWRPCIYHRTKALIWCKVHHRMLHMIKMLANYTRTCTCQDDNDSLSQTQPSIHHSMITVLHVAQLSRSVRYTK